MIAYQFWEFFIPLLFAHLLADFMLQSDTSVQLKHKVIHLLLHGLLVGFLSYLFVGVLSAWELFVGVGLTHLLLDAWKLRTQRGTRLRRFVVDQMGHLLILALFSWAAVFGYDDRAGLWVNLIGWRYLQVLVVLSGGVLSIYVVSFLVELSFEALGIDKLPASSDPGERESLLEEELGIAEGGRIIGYLERGLVTLFVLVGYPGGIGFLVAAKSIFRFGELTNSSRRWQAEYIIIGTLLSILLGSSFAYLTVWVVRVISP